MLIWIIFAVMTGAAIFALLRPLGHSRIAGFTDAANATSLYRAQLGEIERDLARRLIAPDDAEAARAEAARRLLRASGEEAGPAGETEASLRRRRASSALALSCVPLFALLAYGAYGSPGHPDQPLSVRLQADPSRQDFALALSRIETHLAKNPSDAKGWSVIAPIYMRQGRYDDAATAFESAIRHGEATVEAFSGLGEARALAAGGIVTASARESLAEAVRLDPKSARARFFLAIGKEQDGDARGAIVALRELLGDAAADAPWAQAVRERLERLESETAGSAITALPQADRQVAIRAMVDGLAERLRGDGGTLPEWTRLIRSQTVLGDGVAARASLATARARLARDASALAELDMLADELSLKGPAP